MAIGKWEVGINIFQFWLSFDAPLSCRKSSRHQSLRTNRSFVRIALYNPAGINDVVKKKPLMDSKDVVNIIVSHFSVLGYVIWFLSKVALAV